ncbi:MFS transporter [Streptomyces capparidis]
MAVKGAIRTRSRNGSGNVLVRAGTWPARALGRVGTRLGTRIRRATHSGGAGETGLGKLIELHAVNGAGDMLITVALASTVFFSVPTGEARGRVALYLLVTMAPFALLAPIIGPLLDRVPHGRRAAMAMSMLARAVLAWTMAGAVDGAGLELYPAALGVLVSSKAYGVVRSVVVPRLLPDRTTLVKANSRVTLAGLLGTAVAAPVGGLLHMIGPGWPLYGAFAVFVLGTLLAFTLPHKVDSAKGEEKATIAELAKEPRTEGADGGREDAEARRWPGLRGVGSSVLHALQACACLRALSGFLTLFLAFLLREHPIGGFPAATSLGIVAVSAGLGNALGTTIGTRMRSRAPETIITTVLALALGAAVSAAVWYGAVTVALVAATAGFAQALGKLSLDALIQRDVPEEVRTSAFARSETAYQLAWVIGGAIGIMLPLNGTLGLGIAAGLLALGFAATVRGLLVAGRRGSPRPRTV